MEANTSFIDDRLISNAVELAELVENELINKQGMNEWEHDLHYRAQLVLSHWRTKCKEMARD